MLILFMWKIPTHSKLSAFNEVKISYSGGLLDEARANAEVNVLNIFIAALGDECEVVFERARGARSEVCEV